MDPFPTTGGGNSVRGRAAGADRRAVGTPVYVYSTAAMQRQARALQRGAGAARRSADRLMRSRPIPMPRCWRRWRRKGSAPTSSRAANIGAPARPASRRRRSSFPASARPPRRWRSRWKAGSASSTWNRSPRPRCCPQVAPAMGRTAPVGFRVNPDVAAGIPRQDLDRRRAQQVRHSDRRRARRLCAGARPARPRGPGRRGPYRQPADQPRAARGGVREDRRADPPACARTGTTSRTADLGGGLGIAYDPAAPPPPTPGGLWRDGRPRRRRLGRAADLRAGPADRRQCRRAADPGDPGEAGRRRTRS